VAHTGLQRLRDGAVVEVLNEAAVQGAQEDPSG
jgi:hypothetical protein